MKKRILLIITISFFTTLAYVANQQVLKTSIDIVENKSFKEQCLEELHKQEQEIWNKITKKTGIKKEEFAQRIIEQQVRFVDTRISKKTINLIDEVLMDFNVDPQTISLYVKDDEQRSPAAALPDKISICEEKLSAYSEKTQKFIIGHELQHILHNDAYVLGAIHHSSNLDLETFYDEFGYFVRFTELRADIKTMLHQKETYTHGALEFNKNSLNIHGEHNSKTHPKYELRLETAQNILDQKPLQNNTVVA